MQAVKEIEHKNECNWSPANLKDGNMSTKISQKLSDDCYFLIGEMFLLFPHSLNVLKNSLYTH